MSGSSTDLWDIAISKCCQEPVHTPGAIQPFGALIVTDLALQNITHVSANLAEMLALLPEAPSQESSSEVNGQASVGSDAKIENKQQWGGVGVLGRSLRAVLPRELVHDLANVCGLPWISSQRERMGVYEINERSFNVCVHVQGDRTLIELEPLLPVMARGQTLPARLKLILQDHQDYKTVLSQCAQELRHATGFDRIMVYQFLPDGAGDVIAEACDHDMESFLNLRFPATDIPDLARQIFRKVALRPIPDLSAPLVPLLAQDETEAPLDLSLTSIRGASLVHTQEYLPNMGIAGSMTLAITVEGKLWGLFAFHHRQPKLLPPEFRSVIELCGLLISLYIQQKLTEEDFNHQRDTAKLLAQLFGQQVRTDNDWHTLVIQSLEPLCDLISANGLAFVADQQILATYGDVPATSILLTGIEETEAQTNGDILAVNSFSRLTWSEEIKAGDWSPSAGALFVPVDVDGSHHLVFFRNETISEVSWAGNPEAQQVVQGKNLTGVNMRPQRSFGEYKTLVTGSCRPWSRQDIALAQEIQHALETQLFMQERQSLLIAELKHRVKNILALIRSIARQTSRSTQSIDSYIQLLEQRISSLAMAHEFVTQRALAWPRLQDLLELELRPYLNSKTIPPQVTLVGEDVTLNASFVPTFILVIHEMVSNSVKYGALSAPDGQLSIRWFKDRKGLTLLWREANGPPVVPPEPGSRGFGCELIERAIPYEFDGEANLCFTPSGLEANFWLPQGLVKWEEADSSSSPAIANQLERQSTDSPQPLKNLTRGAVLLVEDNMLIAIEMENLLKQFGFSTIDSAPTVDRAVKLLKHSTKPYQVCLLDINLKTETSFAIAYHVRQAQIPVVFISGYDSKHPIPDDLKSIPLLKKPVDSSKLSKMLQSLVGRSLKGMATQ